MDADEERDDVKKRAQCDHSEGGILLGSQCFG
jgi:hypothetical protein